MQWKMLRGILALPIGVAVLFLTGCGGSSSAIQSSSSACTMGCYLSGAACGLSPGHGVKLENIGGDMLTVAYNANSGVAFSATQAAGSSYDITVASHPPRIACSVANGSGTLSADVTDIAVSCAAGTEGILHSLAGGTADGAGPDAGLIVHGAGNLYGTTECGGASSPGTVVEIN